ncbi:alpha/beta fold hydrolase [Pseudomonas bharatica]|uniref:alpha/beta fold hydrolase n=1 Tax=Pseudomonas bharatica TaxID=2692112 RepID=UPI0035DCC803
MADAIGREGFIRQQRAIIERADYQPLLAAIKVPTLVLFGAQDEITPLTEARVIQAGIPGARLEVIEACGHLPPLAPGAHQRVARSVAGRPLRRLTACYCPAVPRRADTPTDTALARPAGSAPSTTGSRRSPRSPAAAGPLRRCRWPGPLE